jgi:septal ring factor EnvC (AmiA/AmiB activator)
MRTDKKTILFLLLIPIILLLNCVSVQEPPRLAERAYSVQKQQSAAMANRFQESAPNKPTVVESAMELSQKHAKLSEETAQLRQQNKELVASNKQLKEQVVAIEAKLQQAQKELNEANDILVAMRIELNNWKLNIIGFRDEMRDAETAQLEALLKILKVLGGEVKVKSAVSNDDAESTAVASLNKQVQPESK